MIVGLRDIGEKPCIHLGIHKVSTHSKSMLMCGRQRIVKCWHLLDIAQ